jgi:hypothetical protein
MIVSYTLEPINGWTQRDTAKQWSPPAHHIHTTDHIVRAPLASTSLVTPAHLVRVTRSSQKLRANVEYG